MRFLNVEKVEKLSDDVYELFLIRDGGDFKVGNCLAIYGPDGKTSRPYSFASGINDSFYSFIIKRFPDGYVSTFLTSLKEGDEVKVSNPYGFFDPGTHPKSVYISTGTGIAPFVSSIRSGHSKPLQLYYGVQYEKDLILQPQLLMEWNINLEISLSRETSPSFVSSPFKYVTGALKGDLHDEKYDIGNTHFYLCGLDAMIEDAIQILMLAGVQMDKIHHECFFNSE